jgi:hypothetical protein
MFPVDEPCADLSPSEQRALQAEKRAAWRQARLKSLEQVSRICSNYVGTLSGVRCLTVVFF